MTSCYRSADRPPSRQAIAEPSGQHALPAQPNFDARNRDPRIYTVFRYSRQHPRSPRRSHARFRAGSSRLGRLPPRVQGRCADLDCHRPGQPRRLPEHVQTPLGDQENRVCIERVLAHAHDQDSAVETRFRYVRVEAFPLLLRATHGSSLQLSRSRFIRPASLSAT